MLADCWFTLAALAGDKAAEAEAAEVIRRAVGSGGRGWGGWLTGLVGVSARLPRAACSVCSGCRRAQAAATAALEPHRAIGLPGQAWRARPWPSTLVAALLLTTFLRPSGLLASRSTGGRLFLSPAHLPAGALKRFAICPHSLPPALAAQLERGNACFALVHPSCRVTLQWVKACWAVSGA